MQNFARRCEQLSEVRPGSPSADEAQAEGDSMLAEIGAFIAGGRNPDLMASSKSARRPGSRLF